MMPNYFSPDPALDLVLERVVEVPPHLVWKAWTTPEYLKQWFTPAPWTTPQCEIDLRPGGLFRTVMRSPEGQEFENLGCYLEVVENQRLAWTNVLLAGFRPAGPPSAQDAECNHLPFTAVISLEPQGGGTRYTAVAMHAQPGDQRRHSEMGFHEGWGTVLEQLVEVMQRLEPKS